MRITYDSEADAASIYFTEIRPGGVTRTYSCDPSEVGSDIHLDFDSDGRLLGVEVLDASRKLPKDLLKT